jgi:hypothetical protein
MDKGWTTLNVPDVTGNAASKASALAGLEAALGLIDHIEPTLAAHEAVVAVATTQ